MMPDANPDIGGDELYAEIHRLRAEGASISSEEAIDAVLVAEGRFMEQHHYAAALQAERELDSLLAKVAHLRLVARIMGRISEAKSQAEEAARLAR